MDCGRAEMSAYVAVWTEESSPAECRWLRDSVTRLELNMDLIRIFTLTPVSPPRLPRYVPWRMMRAMNLTLPRSMVKNVSSHMGFYADFDVSIDTHRDNFTLMDDGVMICKPDSICGKVKTSLWQIPENPNPPLGVQTPLSPWVHGQPRSGTYTFPIRPSPCNDIF